MIERIKRIWVAFKAFLRFSKYLDNGFYNIKRGDQFRSITKSKFGIPILTFRKNGHYKSAKFIITRYEKKVVFLTDDFAYHFYKNKTLARKAFSNFYKYSSLIKYSINTPKELNVSKKLKIEPILREEIGNILLVLNYILDCAIASKLYNDEYLSQKWNFIDKNDILYVQHGDASKRNIFMADGNPIFIDWDDIGVYPALFDFYRLLIRDQESFSQFFNGYFDNKIRTLFKTHGLANLSDTDFEKCKDYYFSLFLKITKQDIKSLRNLIPAHFEQTLEFVNAN